MRGLGLQGSGVWVAPLTGIGAVVWAALVPVSEGNVQPARAQAQTPAIAFSYPADSFAHRVIERDPFRVARRPAAVAYDPSPAAAAAAAVPAPPKPVLVLTGIVWGKAPEAVVEGLPGVEGPRVLRVGDQVAGLGVRRIEPGRVTVVGMDTVWVLTVRQPWKQ